MSRATRDTVDNAIRTQVIAAGHDSYPWHSWLIALMDTRGASTAQIVTAIRTWESLLSATLGDNATTTMH